MNPAALANFRRQAEWCDQLGSPLTGMICRVLGEWLTEESDFGVRVLNWPGDPDADALALRACGALNFHARLGHPTLAPLYPPNPTPTRTAFWRGAEAAIGELDAELTRFLDSAPQTNEVARSAALLPGYLEIARQTGLPLSIREIGASAGLNLAFDQYRYAYGAHVWGPEDGKVRIACEWRGEAPPPSGAVEVADRLGCDIYPVDARDAIARARMLSYVWPDQTERQARAAAALELAAERGAQVEAIDAARFVAREFGARSSGKTLVLAHTIVWQYLPQDTKTAIRAAIAEGASRATAASPLAWLRLEAEADAKTRGGAVLRLSLWPNGPVDQELASASFHGQWVEWRAGA